MSSCKNAKISVWRNLMESWRNNAGVSLCMLIAKPVMEKYFIFLDLFVNILVVPQMLSRKKILKIGRFFSKNMQIKINFRTWVIKLDSLTDWYRVNNRPKIGGTTPSYSCQIVEVWSWIWATCLVRVGLTENLKSGCPTPKIAKNRQKVPKDYQKSQILTKNYGKLVKKIAYPDPWWTITAARS